MRAAKKLVKRGTETAGDIEAALQLLVADAFDPRLRTHKLTGELGGSWACRVGYDLRIVFRFVHHEGNEVILLESIGTHDEVY